MLTRPRSSSRARRSRTCWPPSCGRRSTGRRFRRATPALLRRLLKSCLERDPEAAAARRGRRAHRARRAAARPAGRSAGRGRRSAASHDPGGGQQRLPLAALVGLGAGYWLRRPAPVTTPERWLLAIPDGLTVSVTDQPQLALSRDGRLQVAVVTDARGTDRLLLRRSGELEPRLAARHGGRPRAVLLARRGLDRLLPPGRRLQGPRRGRPAGAARRGDQPVARRDLGRGRLRLLRPGHDRRTVARLRERRQRRGRDATRREAGRAHAPLARGAARRAPCSSRATPALPPSTTTTHGSRPCVRRPASARC